jgi:[acyl-carrier-protein] S-malonyltransferase
MPEKMAFLFPGQGSQFIGMGADFSDELPYIAQIFKEADKICEKPITKLCFDGPMGDLTLTMNLQPAVTTVSLACLAAINESGIYPSVSAGHSLGEYAALTSAGVIDWEDAIRLVNKRGELMHRESLSNPGVMAAVLGMEIEEVTEIVSQASKKGVVAVANHNTAEQIVITGEERSVKYASELIEDNGKKVIFLKVSGAWHCDLMKAAVNEFHDYLKTIPFTKPKTGVLFNATAENESDPDRIRDIMARQLISPVRWYDIIIKMMQDGVDTFVEVGPKKVLSGLVKKIIPRDSKIKIYNVQDIKTMNGFIEIFG